MSHQHVGNTETEDFFETESELLTMMAQMAQFSFPYYFTILTSEFRIPKFAIRISEFEIVKYM